MRASIVGGDVDFLPELWGDYIALTQIGVGASTLLLFVTDLLVERFRDFQDWFRKINELNNSQPEGESFELFLDKAINPQYQRMNRWNEKVESVLNKRPIFYVGIIVYSVFVFLFSVYAQYYTVLAVGHAFVAVTWLAPIMMILRSIYLRYALKTMIDKASELVYDWENGVQNDAVDAKSV